MPKDFEKNKPVRDNCFTPPYCDRTITPKEKESEVAQKDGDLTNIVQGRPTMKTRRRPTINPAVMPEEELITGLSEDNNNGKLAVMPFDPNNADLDDPACVIQ